jgi:nucleoside-diphosphate-sugar epimerase
MYQQVSLSTCFINKKFTFVKGDVRDYSLVKKLASKVDAIIPLAAIVGAPACDLDPILATSTNKESIYKMLDFLSSQQLVIMPTTNSAYGSGDQNNYCDENSPLKPLSRYAIDKVSFRLATVFGISGRMRLDLLVNHLVFRALKDSHVLLYEASYKRNYIHLLDVCQAFELSLQNPDSFVDEIFNVGLSSANLSKGELCEMIKLQLPDFYFDEVPFRTDPDQRNYVVSNAKIESRGFSPKVSLHDGIGELLKGLPMFDQRRFSNI